MPRLVQHNAKMPVEVKAQKQSFWICQCGLSTNQPFCNGSHAKTQEEKSDKLYEYDKNLNRKKVQRKPNRWSVYKLAK